MHFYIQSIIYNNACRRARVTVSIHDMIAVSILQAFPEIFNKAAMMNIGFLSANNFDSYDCFIFHDVDMLLEDDRHIYRCSDNIRHMGVNVDKFDYRYLYVCVCARVRARACVVCVYVCVSVGPCVSEWVRA